MAAVRTTGCYQVSNNVQKKRASERGAMRKGARRAMSRRKFESGLRRRAVQNRSRQSFGVQLAACIGIGREVDNVDNQHSRGLRAATVGDRLNNGTHNQDRWDLVGRGQDKKPTRCLHGTPIHLAQPCGLWSCDSDLEWYEKRGCRF